MILKFITKTVLLAAASLFILACSDDKPERTIRFADPVSDIDEEACKAKGGTIVQPSSYHGAPPLGPAMCHVPITDAGKPCMDSADCQKACLYTGKLDPLPRAGAPARGSCAGETSRSPGAPCRPTVVLGHIDYSICHANELRKQEEIEFQKQKRKKIPHVNGYYD